MKKIFRFLLIAFIMLAAITALSSCNKNKSDGVILLETNGGSISEDFNGSYVMGDMVDLPTPKRSEYYFVGWYTDEALTKRAQDPISADVEGEIKLYAGWYRSEDITLAFNKNLSGTTIENLDDFTPVVIPGEDVIVFPELSKVGYEFLGWYLDKSYSRKAELPLDPSATDGMVELYASWYQLSLITYNNINGAVITNENEYTDYFAPGRDSIVLPQPLRAGYDFLGWYTDSDLTVPLDSSDLGKLDSSATLYAKWSRRKVTISWELDGAIPANNDYTTTFYYEDTVILPEISKSGLNFIGWYLDDKFDTPITESNIKSTNTDITVYALFAPTVDFKIAGVPIEQFTIVIADDAPLDIRDNAKHMQEFFKKRTGHTLPIATDVVSTSAHEILLGETNRTASTATASNKYKISIKDGHFVIDAGNYQGVNEALAAFLEIYGNPQSDVSIPATYTVSGTTKVPTVWVDNGSAEALGSKSNFTIPVKSGTYELVWSDEFDDIWHTGEINTNKWGFTLDDGGVNKEYQDYSTIRMENGEIRLITDLIGEGSRENPVDGYKYKMSQLITDYTMNYRYGYLEMRGAPPYLGTGDSPSFWGASVYAKLAHPQKPTYIMEVDIFETFSSKDTATPSLHKWGALSGGEKGHAQFSGYTTGTGGSIYGPTKRNYTFQSQAEAQKMHTYGFLWTEHVMAFSVDGVFYFAIGLDDYFDYAVNVSGGMSNFREQCLNIMFYNLAFDTNDPSSYINEYMSKIFDEMFPFDYNIDYVRLYQIKDYGDLYVKTEGELKLDLNGGELADSFDGGYLTGETVSLPTPTRDGYTFDGWYTSKNYTTKVSSSYVTNKDGVVTLYARWIAN